MGEYAVSRDRADVLVSIGLGSCIGLAMIDAQRAVVGLAHVMLPARGNDAGVQPGKFADSAVPALADALVSQGASRARLKAVIVGGAQMFSFGAASKLDIGARNDAATREALAKHGIPIEAAATRGQSGRTVRVTVEGTSVLVKQAGGDVQSLFAGSASLVGTA